MFPGQAANANQVARGISGGTLTSDSTHYYRTFTSSGTLSITKGTFTGEVFAIGSGGSNVNGPGGSSGEVAYTPFFKVRKSLIVGIGAGSSSTSLSGQGIVDSDNLLCQGGTSTVSGNGFSIGNSFLGTYVYAYGGGGGASGSGNDGYQSGLNSIGGNGGPGQENPWSSQTNTPNQIAGGAGGNAFEYYYYFLHYAGDGVNGGGRGYTPNLDGTPGQPNTGGGGGYPFPGGSGLAIIKYSKQGADG
jgi:hypothetical protein